LGIPLFQLDLTGSVEDGDTVTLNLDSLELVTGNATYELPHPPDFVKEIQAEGSIVAYVQRYRRFPGETNG
jgi:methanogen homoaconitase small subunit